MFIIDAIIYVVELSLSDVLFFGVRYVVRKRTIGDGYYINIIVASYTSCILEIVVSVRLVNGLFSNITLMSNIHDGID